LLSRTVTLERGLNTMPTASARGYLVRKVQDAPTVPSECGQSTRPLTYPDTTVCNLHVTFIKDSTKHYHRKCTEVYYILQGRGKMELNDDLVDVEPGTVVYIEPYTSHRLYRDRPAFKWEFVQS
jgi:mannose-6-phosphate isomerase-like protein (cupin superfamily)